MDRLCADQCAVLWTVRRTSNIVTTQEAILQALARIKDPDLGRDIVSLGFIKDL
jgi:metal-sulfur cluster biosynthetic enzyme